MNEYRFLTSYGETATGGPGLVLGTDGLVYLARTGGDRVLLDVSPTIQVTLGGDEAFEITATPAASSAGPVTFIVHNIGGFTHECLILKTDLTAAQVIASAPQGGTVTESDFDVVADSGDVPAGRYVRFDLTLAPAHYVLLCNETGHAHLGMASDFEVTQLTGGLSDVSHR